MKTLTIKKIALGLLLAGYAAGSAFALNATTSLDVLGTAPVINGKSTTPSTSDNSIDVQIYHGSTKLSTGSKWSVGDRIKLIFKANDADGDTDVLRSADSVRFSYLKNGSWTASYLTGSSRQGTASDDGVDLTGYQVVEWAIPAGAVNATQIGFIIQPFTVFGSPDRNNWLSISDITNSGTSGDGGSVTPPVIPPVNPPDGGTGGGEHGDGSTGPVQPGDTFGLKIVAVTSSGSVVVGQDYQVANGSVSAGVGTGNVTLTDAYEVQVWDANTDVTADAGLTSYDWYVTGGNSAANGTVPSGADNVYFVQKGSSAQFTLPATNAAVTFTAASATENQGIQNNTSAGAATALGATQPEAGLQGFKLGVWAH
ncbi:hypothetical protein RHO12_07120 [Orbus sturtevantii]|uniref:hypothetical protein n=1 Tax=Orbus sturtevantii TaxID=3074109 RepID=UPI00370D58B6